MSSDFLGDRRQALENSFFAKKNAELLDQLRDQMQTESKRQAISDASGITDEVVLDELLAIGMDGQTVAALSLVPLVEVAWADGSIAADERAALNSACEEIGIKKGSPAFALLQQ
ncbi:MAG: tellurite resistance protein, partial [Pirellulaceae bacterium]